MEEKQTKKDEALEEVLEELEKEAEKKAEDNTEQTDSDTDEKAGSEEASSSADKKKKKKEKKDKKDERIEELSDQVKRQMAEFDNFRKRTEKEKSQMFEIGAKSVIEKILPVIDNFERGLGAVPTEQKEDPFVAGMDKVYKQMLAELENIGVKPIEAIGKEFNPEYHNAVMQVESEEYESGIVAQEMQKGYTYHETVVRHSMVAVVQ